MRDGTLIGIIAALLIGGLMLISALDNRQDRFSNLKLAIAVILLLVGAIASIGVSMENYLV